MPSYWVLCLATSVTCGVGTGWLTLLDVNLQTLGVPQRQVGWLLFGFLIAGVVSGIIIGRIGDYLKGRHKTIILISYICGCLTLLWVTLQIQGIIPFFESTIFIAVIANGLFLSGTRPLVLELVLEFTYPIREGISLSILQLVLNITMLVFYFIQMIPGIGTLWMNWAFTAVCFIALPMLIGFKAKYNRLRLDTGTSSSMDKDSQAKSPTRTHVTV